MNKETKQHLERLLKRIDSAILKTKTTSGYSRQIIPLRLLEAAIKEQVDNEGSHSSTRPTR